MGDPGTFERLDPPHYAYIFVVFKKNNNTYDIKTILGQNLYDGGKTDSDVWEPYDLGDDVIYRCKTTFTELLPLKTLEYCHIYAAMSKTPLTLKSGSTIIDSDHIPANETMVQNITFTVNDDLQEELQNIYSTPCNYLIDGDYYANIGLGKTVTANIILYHVAAKVDLMWNVPEEQQPVIKVTQIKAKHLFQGDSYIFKPTENVHTQFTESDGYNPVALVGDVPSTWWAGRSYFYTIPYRTTEGGQFPLQFDFDIRNTTAGQTYTNSVTMSKTISDVFVPWMRGQITISTPPTYNKSENINLD